MTENLIPSNRQRPQHKFFWMRKTLDNSPKRLKIYKVLLGVFVISHFFLAFAFFTLGKDGDSLRFSLYSLFLLSFEFFALCFFMVGVILYDFFNLALNFAVWQRSAIGRVLRNTLVSLLLFIFMIMCLVNSEVSGKELKINNFWKVSCPLIILVLLSVFKLLMIKGNHSGIWIWICSWVVVQVVLVVVQNDFKVNLDSIFLMFPLIMICLGTSINSLLGISSQLSVSLAGTYSSLSFAMYLIVKVSIWEELLEDNFYYLSPALLGFMLLYCFFSKQIGEFIFDMVFGHLETDYFHYINPPVKSGIRSSTT